MISSIPLRMMGRAAANKCDSRRVEKAPPLVGRQRYRQPGQQAAEIVEGQRQRLRDFEQPEWLLWLLPQPQQAWDIVGPQRGIPSILQRQVCRPFRPHHCGPRSNADG
jgi:hypothetical protein